MTFPVNPVGKPPFLRSLRLLSETMQAFERLNRAQLRPLGLTIAQFDILATLGDSEGMTFRELGAHTLITKGTLTGVVDRLAALGWVERVPGEDDRRTITVRLTEAGQHLFDDIFLDVVNGAAPAFARLEDSERQALDRLLETLRDGLDSVRQDVMKARASGSTAAVGERA